MTPDAPPSEPHPRHTSTYRLQVHAGFSLKDAARIVPYLKRLGVEAVYLSPVTTAVPGSLHGYDVCDPERLSPALGGEEGFRALAGALKEAGMGCVVDIVPNHMAADPVNNPWWRDVLRRGPASRFADFFDIDWRPRKEGLHGKVLLPVLGESYGALLTRGGMTLEAAPDGLALRVHDVTYPIDPDTLPRPAGGKEPSPEAMAEALNGTPGDSASYDGLHDLLERQSYRLGYWRTALHEANYRRFFDVSTLLGIRTERPEVFARTHALLRGLVKTGAVTGVRVDHVDGLKSPHDYLARLRSLIEEEAPRGSAYILVEKILEDGEASPAEWAIDGTTGYDFLGDLERLFVDARGWEGLRRMTREIQVAGDGEAPGALPGHELTYQCKRFVLSRLMGSEMNALADLLDRLSETHRDFRDLTRDDLRLALAETIACLPVYRTYGREGLFPETDRNIIEETLAEAERRNPRLDPSLFDFIRRVFRAFDPSHDPSPLSRAGCQAFALRFQQIMGAAHAKGVEDTAFYRDVALLSLNEVGLWAGCAPLPAAKFHEAVLRRRRTHPFSMLATSTHDTKRGEDVRARLSVLSAMPDRCERAVAALLRATPESADESGDTPQRMTARDECFLYQTMLGCWPLHHGPDGAIPVSPDEAFVERIRGAMHKAVREAKLRTAWIDPDEGYEAAVDARIDFLLRGAGYAAIREHLFPVLRDCAERGMRDSLARVACKCAVPGIPDFYQGSEGWDLSLVDPDNRRPVDFEGHDARLRSIRHLLEKDEASPAPAPEAVDAGRMTRREEVLGLLARWADGTIKGYVTARCLLWRKRHPRLFLHGEYIPVPCIRVGTDGSPAAAPGFVAFRREWEGESLLVLFPVRSDEPSPSEPAIPPGEALLKLPSDWRGATLRHVFTGASFSPRPGRDGCELNVSELLGEFPVAWLWCDSSASP